MDYASTLTDLQKLLPKRSTRASRKLSQVVNSRYSTAIKAQSNDDIPHHPIPLEVGFESKPSHHSNG